jgi:hypothetical protein
MVTWLGFSSSFFERRFSLLSHNFDFTDFSMRQIMPFGIYFSNITVLWLKKQTLSL